VTGFFVTLPFFTHPPTAHAAGNVQINAGGPAATPFVADIDSSGGQTASVSNAIDTSAVTNPAPQAVYQSNRFGNVTYTIPGLTANGAYTVRLHFAEEFWTAAGKRVFNVSINATRVLTNFDIFATTGAEFKAVVEQFSATASSSGSIAIQFATVTDNAQINGLEILAAASSTPTPTSTPGAGNVQINAGGPAATPFVADIDSSGGQTASVSNAIDTSAVTNPAPQAVYQSNRFGNVTYTIPGLTANGAYTVRLHFAEEFWTAAGKRVFNVSINATRVLTNFDIFATTGAEFKAVVEQFSATASSSGSIAIQFATVTDNAQINGLEILAAASSTPTPTPTPTSTPTSGPPNFGPNVFLFTPSTPLSQIQSTVNSIANQQVPNQFGTQRYALLFAPGTYGSSSTPLNFQAGYYTSVAGLGRSPTDVVINGSVDVYNQCAGSTCNATTNFWRSLSNLTINVTTPNAGCYNGEFWAVSQAAPMRRVEINGLTTLQDYCTQPNFSSGGFIADAKITGSNITSGSQQQFLVRNSQITGWSNGVWNQVFSGVVGAPAQCFPAASGCGGPYTTLATSPVTREEPYLYIDASGNDNVFVPSPQTNTSGITWANGPTPGSSLPISTFFIAHPGDSAATINSALQSGKNLLLTPGIYNLSQSISVTNPDTVVLGLGFPTLIPQNGVVPMQVANAPGIAISGLIFDAGATNSPALLQIGSSAMHNNQYASDPPTVEDVFFRIGGAQAGSATNSLIVNSADVILDDIWAWRADHGNGVGWTTNTANTGLVVNGDNVIAYGLFVEHYQQYEVIWNGNGGTDVFFQNEMPYDVPSQAAWMEASGVDGWAAFKVASGVTSFHGYGMGSYSFFNQGINIFAANAFEVPTSLPAGSLHDLLTIFLSTAAAGGILNVVNGIGGSSTSTNPDTPVTVVNYP
jgi:protein involved in polysaccharide export with SLBB domain